MILSQLNPIRGFFLSLLVVFQTGVSQLTGCASEAVTGPPDSFTARHGDDALFQSLGGLRGIERITDQFLYRLAENDKVVHFWQNTNVERFRSQFVTHLCELTGGPCVYEGDTMENVHRGMDIRQSHFNSVAETLVLAMADEKVPTAVVNALLARLAALHDSVRVSH